MTEKTNAEELVEAGSLTSEHVGATVSVTWTAGKITSTVTDRLDKFANAGAFVTLYFRYAQFRPAGTLLSSDQGLRVGFATLVTIKEVSA